MNLDIVIPVRDPAQGKARLAGLLSSADRAALNRLFFRHVLGVALEIAPPARCQVVSRDSGILQMAREAGDSAILETGHGLNTALEQVASGLGREDPLLSLSTDLPFLACVDVVMLLEMGRHAEVVVACDHAGTGTNALLMRRPRLISYRYGPMSHEAHVEEARRTGLDHATCRREAFERDIDTPDDLRALLADFGSGQLR